MEVDDALEMFWEQEAVNNPIPQFSESDCSVFSMFSALL